MSDMMVLGELLEEHRKLKAAVDQFGVTLNTVYSLAENTNEVVTDIMNGTTYAEWIEDLKTSEKESTTYQTDEMMLELCTYRGAVINASIGPLLLQWAIDNEAMGVLAKTSSEGLVLDVDWDSLHTLPDVFGNEAAFEGLINSAGMRAAIWPSTWLGNLMVKYNDRHINLIAYDYAVTTEPGLQRNPSAINALVENCQGYYSKWENKSIASSETVSIKLNDECFLNIITATNAPQSLIVRNTKSGKTLTGGVDFELKSGDMTINTFVTAQTEVTLVAPSGGTRVTMKPGSFVYV